MKQEVIDVLKNMHTQKIRFTYTSADGVKYRIYPNDFLTVALNIQQGNIDVQQGGVPAGLAKYTVSQDSNSKANTFYIGRNNAAQNVFHSLFVHESIHAIYDVKGIVMPWLDNEAIAYVAQGFYLVNAGKDGGLSEQTNLGYLAAQIYQEGADEDNLAVADLRQSLINDPLYKQYINGNFEGDGI